MTGRVFSKLLLSFVLVLTICTAVLDFSIRRIVDRALHEQVEQSLAGEARFLAAELSFTLARNRPSSFWRPLPPHLAAHRRLPHRRLARRQLRSAAARYSLEALPAIAALKEHEGVGREMRDGTLFMRPAGKAA